MKTLLVPDFSSHSYVIDIFIVTLQHGDGLFEKSECLEDINQNYGAHLK